jgi:6-phosphogluconolactonase
MKYSQRMISLAIALFAYGASAESLTTYQAPHVSTYLVGTYTNAKSQGIELLSFDQNSMALSSKVVANGIKNPSFVIANRARTQIFAVEDTENGKVRSFAFDQNQQYLKLLDEVDSSGAHPCYLALDISERFLAVANYASGNFSIYEVDSVGGLHFKQTVQHLGSSINKHRQNNAHVHSMVFLPNGKQLLVADLGTDKIHIYDINFSSATPITQASPAYFKVASGSGPRHMAIHPNGKVLYLIHELTGEVGVYFYENGEITHANTHSLTSPKFKGHVQAAEIRISPDGKFVYVSNRGSANDLSVFAVGLEGNLSLVQQISTTGRTPRNFNLSLDGHFILVANQESDDVRIFQRNLMTGLLGTTASKIWINKPVYIFPLY